jgi:hypothetical protein
MAEKYLEIKSIKAAFSSEGERGKELDTRDSRLRQGNSIII